MHVRGLLAILLALTMFAAACGGDSDDGGNAADILAGNDDGDGGGDDGGGDDGSNDDVGSDDDMPADEPDDEPMSGDSGSDWCDAVRDATDNPDDSPLSFDLIGMSSEELEEQFKENLSVIESWANQAPSEIEDDVEVIVDTYRTFIDMGNDAGWDFNAMATDPAFASAFEDSAIDTASNRIDQYTRDVCGVDLGIDSGGAAAPPAAPEISEDDDLITQIFTALGIPAGFIPEDIANCMNDSLEASGVFDGGFTQADLVNEAAFDAIDAAADACGFEDF